MNIRTVISTIAGPFGIAATLLLFADVHKANEQTINALQLPSTITLVDDFEENVEAGFTGKDEIVFLPVRSIHTAHKYLPFFVASN